MYKEYIMEEKATTVVFGANNKENTINHLCQSKNGNGGGSGGGSGSGGNGGGSGGGGGGGGNGGGSN